MEYCNKDAYLWSVLPLTGISSIPPKSGTFTNLPTLKEKKCRLYGVPYNESGNLRVLTFTNSSLKGPVINSGPVLYLFSGLAIYTVKWKLLGPDNVKVGFYTPNWLPTSSNEDKYYLFPTNIGISLFVGNRGEFTTTSLSVLSVIVEGNYPMELEVSYCNPKSITYPDLKLYIPQTYAKWCSKLHCGLPIMTQELFNRTDLLVLIKPVPKYFVETATRIQYLEDKAINLIFGSDATFPLIKSLSTTELIGTFNYGTFIFGSESRANNLLGSGVIRFGNALSSEEIDWLKSKNQLATQYYSAITLKTITIPGINVVGVVSGEIVQEAVFTIVRKDTTWVISPIRFVFGSIGALGSIFNGYEIRGLPCEFIFPGLTHKTQESGFTIVRNLPFQLNLPGNVESFGITCYGADINFTLTSPVTTIIEDFIVAYWKLILKINGLKVDFYKVT